MESSSNHYTLFQRLRSTSWETRKQEPSNALIQVIPQGVRIAIYLPTNNILVALDEIQFTSDLTTDQQFEQFKRFIPESVLSEAAISSITISVEPRYFTFLPTHLFSEESAEASLMELSEISFPFIVMTEKVRPEMVLVFAAPKIWYEWAEQVFSFSEIHWTCSISGMLEPILNRAGEKEVFAHIDPKSFIAFGVENGKLLFANYYPFKAENDLLYFMLLVMQEMELTSDTGKVNLSGSILSGSAGFEKLNRYFGNLSFVKNPDIEHEFSEYESLRHPLYFDLVSLLLKPIPA